MSSNWNNTNDTTGILRKSNHTASSQQQQQQQNSDTNRLSELLVFGYACKIFRDDEKAIYIDQGKHLIPWMGDDSLKIDRYDVRATLSDLTQYEPPPGGYINRLDYLSPAEQRAEQLCEEERYYSLYHNDEEEEMYQEEELKRLQQQTSSSYGQVNFDYNQSTEQSDSNKESSSSSPSTTADENKSDEPDELYTPPVNLNVPESMETPETMKLHAIIEKTAKFISTQGPQMEILIKAKQSNNPQFEFLNINNRLNPYYKFVLELFKNGTYPIQPIDQENDGDKSQKSNDNQKIGGGNIQGNFPSIQIPTIKYKPSANCAYTQLISKIKGVPLPPEQPLPEEPNLEATTPTLLTHYAQHYQAQQNYAGTISGGLVENTVTVMMSEAIDNQQNDESSKDTNISKTEEGVEIKKISSGLALAQCYASDTEEENECSETDQSQSQTQAEDFVLNFPIPPENLQNIIDKTATYVIKNGQQFEDILRTKNDERFLFLNPSDEYHQYYMYKVTGIAYPYPTSNGIVEDVDSSKPKIITPVSFSIKTKDDASVSIKPALPQETSDDELESKDDKTTVTPPPPPIITTNTAVSNQNVNQQQQQQQQQQNPSINPVTKATVPEHVQRAIQLVESQLMSRGAQYAAAAAAAAVASSSTTTTTIASVMSVSNNTTMNLKESASQKSRFDVDNVGIVPDRPLAASLLSTPSSSAGKVESVQQKELKRAEEKVKDRLAQIAREKLGLISKEKQLQLERKKKAMAFLNQIKSSGVSIQSTTGPCPITDSTTDQHENENVHCTDASDSNSDTSSVHSVPISSPSKHDDDDENNDDINKISVVTELNEQKPKFDMKKTKNHEKTSENCSIVQKRIRSRSRSPSRSSKQRSSSHKHKKKSKHHSKKKSKKKSRSRSRSRTKSVVKMAANNNRGCSGGSSNSSLGGGEEREDNYHHHHHHHNRRRATPHHSPTPTHRDRKHKRRHSTSPSRKSKKKKRD